MLTCSLVLVILSCACRTHSNKGVSPTDTGTGVLDSKLNTKAKEPQLWGLFSQPYVSGRVQEYLCMQVIHILSPVEFLYSGSLFLLGGSLHRAAYHVRIVSYFQVVDDSLSSNPNLEFGAGSAWYYQAR